MSQLNFLEWLDANLPWALLLAVLALSILGWGTYSMFNRSRSSFHSSRTNSSASRNDTEIFALESRWNSKRDYSAVYDKAPSGKWFEDERKICAEFLERLAKPPLCDKYPVEEKKYLEIVKESDSKPFSIWLWLLVLGLLAAEATSMAFLVADILNASGTQQQTSILAIAILVLIMVLTVSAPKFVAYFQRNQSYAYNLYAELPNSNLNLEGHGDKINKEAGVAPDNDGNTSDENLTSALRMMRRQGNRVRTILNTAIRTKSSPSQYNKAVYVFALYLIAASVGIYVTRDKIIDQLQKEEAAAIRQERDAAREARSNTPADRPQSRTVQSGDSQDASELSQEAREAKADAQRRGILIFIFLFSGIQIIVFLLSVGRGFCSAKGEDCYHKIEKFKRQHGDVSRTEYDENVATLQRDHRMEVTAAAQRTLAAWQLGLNTALSDPGISKNVDPPILNTICALVKSSNERTFFEFCDSAYAKNYLSDLTKPDSSGKTKSVPENGAATGIKNRPDSATPTVDSAANNSAGGALVEYVEDGDTPGAPPKNCSLSDLKQRVADADADATCRVRFKGDNEYVPYSVFVRMEKRFRAT